MKKQIVAVLLMCSVACAAETVSCGSKEVVNEDQF